MEFDYRKSNLKLNIALNAFLKVSAFIFPLITFPYVSRVIGASGNGEIAFAESVVSYFSIFAQLGIPTYGIKKCAEVREDKDKLSHIVYELLIINSLTIVISYICLFICVNQIPQLESIRYLICISSLSIFLNGIGVDWLFQALEQYKYITIRNLSFKLLSVLLLFAFVHSSSDILTLELVNIVGGCGSNILNFIYARQYLSPVKVESLKIRRHFKFIFSFFLLSVSVSVYTSLDSSMLGFLSTSDQVGYYAAGVKTKAILTSAVSSVGAVLLPRMSACISIKDFFTFNRLAKKSIKLVLLVAMPLSIYFSLMADPVILFLAGEGYAQAVPVTQILAFTVLFIGISNIFGMQILVPTNRERITVISTLVGALVDFIINAVLIPTYGSFGAAVGTFTAELSVLLVQLVALKGEIKNYLKDIQLKPLLVSSTVSSLALFILGNVMSGFNPFVELAVTFTAFICIYFALLCLLKDQFVLTYLGRLKNRVSR